MNWTKKAPTEIGFYWWRENINFSAKVVRVGESGRVYPPGDIRIWDTAIFGGEWFGPLSEPGGDAIEN